MLHPRRNSDAAPAFCKFPPEAMPSQSLQCSKPVITQAGQTFKRYSTRSALVVLAFLISLLSSLSLSREALWVTNAYRPPYNRAANRRFFQGKEWISSENVSSIPWGREDDYEASEKLGKGEYSTVYAGRNIVTGKPIVLKLLKEIEEFRINREIDILNQLRNHPNIITLLDATRNPVSNITTLVFERVETSGFAEVQQSLTIDDLRIYLRKILEALAYAHAHNVMHRDLKPKNLILSHRQRDLKIIDWGLATWYNSSRRHSSDVATPDYRAPELILGFSFYNHSVDMWSIGCIFAEMIFRSDAIFEGDDEKETLDKAARVLGSDGLYLAAQKYWLGIDPDWIDYIQYKAGTGFEPLINDENRDLATREAIDLLEKMLTWDIADRITARDALNHDFFVGPSEKDAASLM